MIDEVLGTDVVVRPTSWATRRRLRVLAYHGVTDGEAFARQVEYLVDRWNPVTSEQVLDGLRSPATLPERAVWLTFDDGLVSTVSVGREVLDAYGVEGTVFVNPGAIGEGQWWSVIDAVDGAPAVAAAKLVSDDERRERVRRARARLGADEVGRLVRQVATFDDLRVWIDAGHTVGNHTWDHPCLDRCRPDDQLDQIDSGANALVDAGLMPRLMFAYPNGNRSDVVDDHLAATDYEIGLLFDHRVARLDDPLAVSRLRVDAASSLPRFKAIVSGVHPTLMRLRQRMQRGNQSS